MVRSTVAGRAATGSATTRPPSARSRRPFRSVTTTNSPPASRLSQGFGDTSFGAKVGTTQSPGDNGTVSASAGAKLSSGLTVSGAWGSQEGAADPSFFQAMVGYVTGDTSVAVSWYASSDFVNDGSEGTVIGIGVNHNLPTIGANVYAAAQNYAAEDATADIDTDATVLMIGTRIKF